MSASQPKVIRLGGHSHELRFRTLEIARLEDELGGVNIIDVFQKQRIGVKFLIKAVKVGTEHEIRGKKGRAAVHDDEKIAGWIDECDDFAMLLQTVVEAVVEGLPIELDLEDDEEEATPPLDRGNESPHQATENAGGSS